MIELDVADLVLIASQTLGISPEAALARLDIAAAAAGAGLMDALLRHRPFPGHGEQVAAAAGLQFLAVNGWRADLDPPGAAASVIEGLASGQMSAAYAAAWLSPRLSARRASPAGEASRPAQLPGLRARTMWIIRTQVAALRQQLKSTTPGIHTPATGFIPFTDHARDSIGVAMHQARRLGHDHWNPEHLLLGLIGADEGLAARALERLGISPEAVRQQVGQITAQADPGPHPPPPTSVIDEVLGQVVAHGLYYIGTEQLLLALVRAGGPTAQALARLGAGESEIRGAITSLRVEAGRKRSA
jgi:Clp amino terminal domain, pathogenicity island component